MAELCNVGVSTSAAANQPSEVEVDIPAHDSFDILAGRFMKVNQESVVELSKEENKNPTEKERNNCKILKFLPEWAFENILKEISKLDPKHYQSLFIFVINVEEVPEDEAKTAVKSMLEDAINRFSKSRQIIIQLTSENEKKARIFYNEDKSMKVLQEIERDSNESGNFASFLRTFLSMEPGTDETREEKIFRKFLEHSDKLTLRFLTIFQQTPEFSFRIISHCAANFSKSHFLAALSVPFEDDEGSLNKAQSKMIYSLFKDQKYRSVLEAALDNENFEVFEYLNCDRWILVQQLPADHQIEIANKLVQEKKVDKLCDLLEASEFLFPTGIDLDTIKHRRFEQIISQRRNFHAAIMSENYREIDEFIKQNSENADLKIAYSTDNKSALFTALSNSKGDAFVYLKEKGFSGNENIADLQKSLMLKNFQNAQTDPSKAAQIMAARSKIHHRQSLKGKESEQREKIKSWFEAIQKTELGSPLINAAVQCDDLKIIFDFGRDDVAGVDLDSTDSDGITYMARKVIIIGAKYSAEEEEQDDKKIEAEKIAEQKIKGTLAHELAHYVIGMVFGNEEQPYFNKSDERYLRYRKIVDKCKYLKEDEKVNDGCEGIISKVYRLYNESDYDAELIVRIFQILARYDGNPEKVEELKEKYSDLFEFGFKDVVPEMEKLNFSQFEFVKIFNAFSGLLPNICKKNLELSVSKVVKSVLDKNKLTIVTSNVPKLFLIEAYNHLKELYGSLAGSKNVFVTQECLEKVEITNHLKVLLERNQELKAFVDFSGGHFEILKYLKGSFQRCFVIVVSDEGQSKEVARVLEKEGLKSEELTIDYEWEKLSVNAQSKLLQYEVNFQNHKKTFLQKLFGNELEFSNIFDSKTLNMILNDHNTHVNIDIGLERNIHFELLYLERGFVKCEKRKEVQEDIKEQDDKKANDEENDDEESDDQESTSDEVVDEGTEYEESSDSLMRGNSVDEENDVILEDSDKSCEIPSRRGRFTKFWRNFSGIFQSCSGMFNKNRQTCSSLHEGTDDKDILYSDQLTDLKKENTENESTVQLDKPLNLISNKRELNDEGWNVQKTELKDEIEKTFVESDKLFDESIVLISDVAGSGKSWAMRNLAIELVRSKSTHWVTFVDLKQFIPYFKENIRTEKAPNFHAFIVENVLEKKTKFELEIFKLKYAKGEAAIFLDGFDEIAPFCAEYVRKIIKTFNFSNQLFISTRDYFEVDLQKDLDVNFAYKLDALSNENGKDLIARIWRLNDFKSLESIELQKDIISSIEYEEYIESAIKLIDAVKEMKSSGIGLPQIYSMMAKITKEKKVLDGNLSTYQLYLKMYEMTYDEWSTKNELRKEVNTESQKWKLNFLKLHELKALQRFEPGKSKYCDINPRSEWKEVLVDGCGILAKREKDFVFIHETFYEFFVAEFILRNLRDLETAAEAFEYMQEVIVARYTHKIIRKFLNEGLINEKNESLHDENIFDEIKDERFELLAKNVNKSLINSRNVCDIFIKELRHYDCFGDFLMEVMKKIDIKLEDMIEKDLKEVISYWGKNNLEKLQGRLIKLIKSKLDLLILVNAAKKLNENVVQDSLKCKDDKYGRNIFRKLADEGVENEKDFEKFLAFLNSFLTPREIADLMKECDEYGKNIFHYWRLHENFSTFEVFFRGFKKFFLAEFSLDNLKAILMQKDKVGRNVVNILEENDFNQADELKTFWNLFLETFENDKKGLLKIIMERDYLGENCFQKLLNSICKSDNVEFNEIQLNNLNGLKVSKQELSKLLTELDFYGNNSLGLIFSFREYKLSLNLKKLIKMEILSREEVKSLLSSLNKFGQNVLQVAALVNIKFDMLKVFQEFFNSEEIFKFLKHRDIFGKNYLDICLMHENKEVVEGKISEIIEEMTKSGSISKEEQLERLKTVVKNKTSGSSNEEDLKVLSLDWIQVETSNEIVQSIEPQELKELLLHESENGENYIHQSLWYKGYTTNYIQSILAKVEAELDTETLKKLFYSTNEVRKNLMQVLVRREISASFYEYLWKLMRKNFDNETILDILKHKDKYGRNFLMTVAEYGTNKIVEITWRQIEEISENSGKDFENQITKMVEDVLEESGSANILHRAASSKNCSLSIHLTEVGKFIKNMKELVTEYLDEFRPTILFLHSECENKKCHETLLNFLLNCFENRDEFFKFLMRREKAMLERRNFIEKLIEENKTGKIVGFVLETLKNILNEDQFVKILMYKDEFDRNLLHIAFEKSENIKTVESVWNYYEENLDNFSEVIFKVDKYGRNIIYCAAQNSTAEVLDFLCEKLKNLNENEKVKKAILSQSSLLVFAAWLNKSKESHESLWKLLHTFLDKYDILRMVNFTDRDGQNVLQRAVEKNTKEVVEFILSQIKALKTEENERNEYLRRKHKKGKSLIEFAIENEHYSSEMVELVKNLKNM